MIDINKAKECPELWRGQEFGRPDWQKRFSIAELERLDLMAARAMKSEADFEIYRMETEGYRRLTEFQQNASRPQRR